MVELHSLDGHFAAATGSRTSLTLYYAFCAMPNQAGNFPTRQSKCNLGRVRFREERTFDCIGADESPCNLQSSRYGSKEAPGAREIVVRLVEIA